MTRSACVLSTPFRQPLANHPVKAIQERTFRSPSQWARAAILSRGSDRAHKRRIVCPRVRRARRFATAAAHTMLAEMLVRHSPFPASSRCGDSHDCATPPEGRHPSSGVHHVVVPSAVRCHRGGPLSSSGPVTTASGVRWPKTCLKMSRVPFRSDVNRTAVLSGVQFVGKSSLSSSVNRSGFTG